ncbi:eukaryotic translation initiation factor 3 subunit A isoform X1 [Takifugu rubripes]|uniref:eukaryotic translation initiation factor 3 subunit A isoform X1 n=1 Tax=Takifugu rubripes TaxID=31033 RepID=UPI00114593FF|nr:eukaryotic translation initiation factor 3 subunit A-like isoform X1 [Takifugu rubripes]
MSDVYFEMLRKSNHIPSGRQLPRTPPLADVKRHLDFLNEDPVEACEMEKTGSRSPDEPELNRTFDFHKLQPKTELSDHTMLKGMKGYQLTHSDLEFIRTLQEDKLIQKLQRDLEEVKKLLKVETLAAEKSLVLRERALAELDKLPSITELTQWATLVLAKTRPSTRLDSKCLLSMVKKEDVQRVIKEKETELARLEEMVKDKRKKEAEQREQLERLISEGQLKVRELMSDLSKLKSELTQQEEVQKTLQSQIKIQESAKIKAEAAKVEPWERGGGGKSLVKGGGKEGKAAAGDQDGAQPQRRRVASAKPNKQSGTKDRARNPNTVKTTRVAKEPATKGPAEGKPATKGPAEGEPATKGPAEGEPATKGPAEGKPATKGPAEGEPATKGPAEGEPATKGPAKGKPATKGPAKGKPLQTNPKQSGGGRGRPPAVAPRPRKHVKQAAESSSSRGQSAAEGEEGAPNTGLRRSKRIANRK